VRQESTNPLGLHDKSGEKGFNKSSGRFGYVTLEASRAANRSFFAELGDRSALVVMDTVLCGLITIWLNRMRVPSVLLKWQ
jgi:hypothetical protein